MKVSLNHVAERDYRRMRLKSKAYLWESCCAPLEGIKGSETGFRLLLLPMGVGRFVEGSES